MSSPWRLHDIASGLVGLHVLDAFDTQIDLMEAREPMNACASLPCASPGGWLQHGLRVLSAIISIVCEYLVLQSSASECT